VCDLRVSRRRIHPAGELCLAPLPLRPMPWVGLARGQWPSSLASLGSPTASGSDATTRRDISRRDAMTRRHMQQLSAWLQRRQSAVVVVVVVCFSVVRLRRLTHAARSSMHALDLSGLVSSCLCLAPCMLLTLPCPGWRFLGDRSDQPGLASRRARLTSIVPDSTRRSWPDSNSEWWLPTGRTEPQLQVAAAESTLRSSPSLCARACIALH